jgi:glycosyltransferase involved in cell wall biosynthesis
VKAYQQLPADMRSEYKLLLVGETDLPYGELVVNYVKQNSLQDVILHGKYPYADLPSLYQNASLFVFASTCENCPNILLEALGSGVPILCSNYEPMPEFGGAAVTYMNPDSPEDIATKIEQSLKSGTSTTGSFKQAEKFSWEQTAEKTWKLLLEL